MDRAPTTSLVKTTCKLSILYANLGANIVTLLHSMKFLVYRMCQLIKKLLIRLDILEGELTAVTRVRGSDRLQTAYRLDRQVDLTKDTRLVPHIS